MRIGHRFKLALCALGFAAALAAPAHAACYLAQVGAFPVKSDAGQMVVQADVDGKTVELVLDTGSQFTVISATAARLLGLHVHTADNGLSFGGRAVSRLANIENLYFGHFTLRNINAIVADETPYDGRLGRDVLGDYDVDVDLAHNIVRLLRTSGCSDAQMIYWGGTAFGEAPLPNHGAFLDDYRTVLGLNGHDVVAVLDTGTPHTIVSAAAARVVQAATDQDQPRSSSSSSLFQTVVIGDETVRNARLEVTDLANYRYFSDANYASGSPNGEANYALIGGDFFRSHHVLISPSHHKVFFTYLGGPIFAPSIPQTAAK